MDGMTLELDGGFFSRPLPARWLPASPASSWPRRFRNLALHPHTAADRHADHRVRADRAGLFVWKLRGALDWRKLWPFVLGAALGVPVGVGILTREPRPCAHGRRRLPGAQPLRCSRLVIPKVEAGGAAADAGIGSSTALRRHHRLAGIPGRSGAACAAGRRMFSEPCFSRWPLRSLPRAHSGSAPKARSSWT